MKKLITLLPVVALFLASSLAGRAGTEMVSPAATSPGYPPMAGYWVQPPPPAYYYPPVAYYAPPPPYYGYPGYYGGYYGPGPGVSFYGPGLFFGFGFHGHGRR